VSTNAQRFKKLNRVSRGKNFFIWSHRRSVCLRVVRTEGYNYLPTYPTAWCRNPKVHHRIHNSPPTAPIPEPSETIPQPPAANLHKVHFDPILPSTPGSSKWSFYFGLSHQNPVHVSSLSHAYHMPRPPHSPWFDLSRNIWCKNYEAPHCETFSILPLLRPSYVQIFSSVPCSQTPSVYALPLMLQTKFHTNTKQLAKLWFCIF
jgi:hypothetical protein